MGMLQSQPVVVQSNQKVSNKTMSNLDLKSYMGEWHEIAKYPFRYQGDCDRAKAIYKWDADNKIMLVENQCWTNGKMIRSRTAKAWVPDKSDKGKLKLQFEGFPRDPNPGDYWVHWTDYNNAIVGGPSGTMLWWLSRKPRVRPEEVEPMLERIRKFGYNTDRLMAHPSVIQK